MTTRSQKRKAVEELVSTEIETPIPETSQNLNPVAGTSKSPRVLTENLEEIKSSLRKEIMSDLTKILAENQKEMLKLIAPPVKKQTIITATEETDSEPENIPENATSTPIKNKTTATTRKITPVNSRNSESDVSSQISELKEAYERKLTELGSGIGDLKDLMIAVMQKPNSSSQGNSDQGPSKRAADSFNKLQD